MRGTGWEALPAAIDEASRLDCTEVLLSERREDRIAFLTRSSACFAVTAERVRTDDGSARRSFAFRDASRADSRAR
ncbi:hypothetical protein [Acuticoccus sp.]|uniref:hypothetical protein n=1 Tax=Acuticoccus sp. TaxID=1904378 RepID=UPI003B51699F